MSNVAKICQKSHNSCQNLPKVAKSCQKLPKVAKSCQKLQKGVRCCRKVPKVANVARLSTKLSTIWQIIDYLSKKIDYRLIVDIINSSGHPALADSLWQEATQMYTVQKIIQPRCTSEDSSTGTLWRKGSHVH